MSEHLMKLALVVALTHGFRTLSTRVGPRWGGLALGLPCSTAVALVGSGSEQGVDYARAMAETSLLGLVGAVALPLAYARAIGRRWGFPWPPLVAVGAFLAAASLAGVLAPPGSGSGVPFALMAVLSATALAGRIAIPEASRRVQVALGHPARTWAIRTMVPAACLMASLLLGRAFGPGVAGLMSTFPGLTLTVLLLTHLEAGPGAVVRLARTLPPANLGMVAFLGSFHWGIARFGLSGGTGLAYLASIAALAFVAWFADVESRPALRRTGRGRSALPDLHPWPKSGRQFSPLVERLAA